MADERSYLTGGREERIDPVTGRVSIVRRISWPAVFAGTVVAIASEVVLVLLGTGIGLDIVQQSTSQPTISSVPTGTGIWWLVTFIVALFIGGMVAGRIAAMPQRTDAGLHGLVTWGLTVLFSCLMLATTAGPLMGGSINTISQSLAIGTAPAHVQLAQPALAPTGQHANPELVPAYNRPVLNGNELAIASWWTFCAILVGAFAAWVGGTAGSPLTEARSMPRNTPNPNLSGHPIP